MNFPVGGFPPAPAVPAPAPAPVPAAPAIVVQGTPSSFAPPIPMSGVTPQTMAAPAPVAEPAPAPSQPYVFQGDNLPPELRGATAEQVLGYYQQLRTHYLNTATPPSAPPPPQNMPAAAPQPVVEKPSAADFWSNPIDTIERVVQNAVAPVTQATQRDAIVNARNVVAQNDPNYAQHEAAVLQQLQGVSNEALADPRTWEFAYNMVLGQRYRAGQLAPAAPATPAPVPAPVAPSPSRFAPTTYFTEPSRPNGSATPVAATTDAGKQAIAAKMGMTYEQYTSWERMLGGQRNG